VIKSFRHAGIEEFYKTGSKRGINPEHAQKLNARLSALDQATSPSMLNVPGWRLHTLTKELAGHWSIRVSGGWRLTFTFDGDDVILLDYQDYH